MVPSTSLLAAFPGARRAPLLTGLVAAVLGSALLTLSAKIQVPFWPVPMTLQTLAVMALAGLFGMRAAGLTVMLYLLEGALGLPVFAGTPQRGVGLAYMLGPTGGYLVGYILAALLIGFAADRGARNTPLALFAAMLAGLALIYGLGALWLTQFTGVSGAISAGVLPFLAGDLTKAALAAALVVLGARAGRSAS
jgi:biotin transport system substrate-specific component